MMGIEPATSKIKSYISPRQDLESFLKQHKLEEVENKRFYL
jgi:hypothetical protein